MTATAVFVSEEPPLITVSVAKHIVSHELIEQAGEFVLITASPEQVELARQLGATHGDKVDKFPKFNLKTAKAAQTRSPVIKGSYANLECRVITSMTAATHTVYLAEVVALQVNRESEPIAWFDNTYRSLKSLNQGKEGIPWFRA